MKTQFLYLLLILSALLFGCSKKAPEKNDVLAWITSNDTATISQYIKEFQTIKNSEKVDSIYRRKCWDAYDVIRMNVLKFDNSDYYKMFGVWFEENTFFSWTVFDSIPPYVLSKNIKYMNEKWINIIVEEMLISPKSYSIFLDEFIRRMDTNSNKNDIFLALALWKYFQYLDRIKEDNDYFKACFNISSIEYYILKYPDLLDKTKYQTLLELCKQPSKYYNDIRYYNDSYDRYLSCRKEFNNAREELRTELAKCPYGIPQENLAYINSLQLKYDKAKNDFENTSKELDRLEAGVKKYNQSIKDILKAIDISAEPYLSYFRKAFQ